MNPAVRPCAELTSGAAIRFALKWQLVGLLLMASHVLLVKQSVFLAPLMFLVLGWLYANAPLAGLIVWLQILIYQNWIIGLLSQGMAKDPTFTVLQGTNFVSLVIMAMIAWSRVTAPAWRSLRPLLIVVVVAVIAATIYWGVGAMKEGVTSATIYFRDDTALVFGVLVGLDVGRIYGYRTVALGFLVSVALSLALGYVEVVAPEAYYNATNAVAFNAIKTLNDPKYDAFYSAQDIIFHNEVILFNLSGSSDTGFGGVTQIRFMGTIMHPISYAYVVAAAALVAFSVGFGGWLFLIVPLLMASAVKGAMLLFICTMCLWCIWSGTRSNKTLAIAGIALMALYVGFGITFGQDNGDYHVIGFLGGVHSFMADPLGHGIGVGGNLSQNASAGFNWQKFQASGASFALESAVGVLLFQMGVASAAIFAVFIMLLKMAPFDMPPYGKRIPHRHSLILLGLATVAVNGVFQEEAYAPTAAGLFTLLAAIIIANGDRPMALLTPNRHLRAAGTRVAHV